MIEVSQKRINQVMNELIDTEAVASVWQVLSQDSFKSAGHRVPDGVRLTGEAFSDPVRATISCALAAQAFQEILRHTAKKLKKGKVPLDTGVAMYVSVLDPSGKTSQSGMKPIQASELLRCVSNRKARILSESLVSDLLSDYLGDFSEIGVVTVVIEPHSEEDLDKLGQHFSVIDMQVIEQDADEATVEEALA